MPASTMNPLVVDCYQGEEIKDWTQVYAFGIRGVIHKASEGSNFRDKTYATRKDRARKAGLLWGAYHFMNDTAIETQVANFLDAAQPDDAMLLALDYEENKHRTGSLEQARQFLQLVYERTGQRPVLYSGNLIKEQLRRPDPFFNQHRLWLAQYGPRVRLPAGWQSYWLWQYTGDGVGPEPHEVPGIATRGIDLNVFGGADLAAEWAPQGDVPIPVVVSSDADDAPTAADTSTEPIVIPAADPPKEKVGFRERARVLEEMIAFGSRLGTSIRGGINTIRALLFGTTVIGGTTVALVDPNKGTAAVATKTLQPFPVLLVAILAFMAGVAIVGAVAWWYFHRSANGLVTAKRANRYLPPKQPTTETAEA